MTPLGHLPWRPLVDMGDGTGGYDSPRRTVRVIGSCDGHTLRRDACGCLYDHGPHGVFGVRGVPGETEEETVRRWREGVMRGWYGR